MRHGAALKVLKAAEESYPGGSTFACDGLARIRLAFYAFYRDAEFSMARTSNCFILHLLYIKRWFRNFNSPIVYVFSLEATLLNPG